MAAGEEAVRLQKPGASSIIGEDTFLHSPSTLVPDIDANIAVPADAALSNHRVAPVPNRHTVFSIFQYVTVFDGALATLPDMDTCLPTTTNSTVFDNWVTLLPDLNALVPVIKDVADLDNPFTLLIGEEPVHPVVMEPTAPDNGITPCIDRHSMVAISVDVTVLDESLSVIVAINAALSIAVDFAALDDGCAAFADLNAVKVVFEDLAVLDGPPASFVDENARVLSAVVDSAAAEYRVRRPAVDADTGERVGGDIAVLNNQFPLGYVEGEPLYFRCCLEQKRHPPYHSMVGLHLDTVLFKAMDDDLLCWSLTE